MKQFSILIYILLLSVSSVLAQPARYPASNYSRADSLVAITSDKVYYGAVRPTWIGGRSMFLYENYTPAGTEYIIINPSSGSRRRAFDQVRFAEAFTRETGVKAEPGKLPITGLVFTERQGSFAFTWNNRNWICDTREYRISKRDTVIQRPASVFLDWSFRDELGNSPVLSPDKKWSAYIKNYNVWVRSLSDKKEYQLSFDGGTGEYYSSYMRWSPDSRKLVSSKVKPAEKHIIHFIESSPADQLQPKYHSWEYPKPGDAVPQFYPQLFDIVAMKQLPVDNSSLINQYSVNNITWYKNSSCFTFEYNRRGHQLYQVIRVDANTGMSNVIINESSPTFIDYSGKKIRQNIEDAEEIIWASERDGWNHLYLYDAVAGKVKNQITKGEWVVREIIYTDNEKRQLIFKAGGMEPGDPYYTHYYRINFDGSGLKRLTQGEGNHEAYFSPDKKYLIDTWSAVNIPPVSVLRNIEGESVMLLEKADVTELQRTGVQFPEPFTAKGRDGKTDIWGIIIRPSNFDPAKKYPVIEYIYAGPHSSFVPKSFRPLHGEMHQLTELGFIIVQIDGMGTSNRSKAFHDVCWKNIKDAGFPDRILWIKEAAAKYPYMDITRVGIFGGSAGGQNSAGALLFYPEFYKVAVSACGCHDNRMDKIWWNEQWMGWPVGKEYAESSNIENAWRLKGKLLLINGEMDDNVDPASTEQFVNALVKANKEFEYVFVPGAKHISNGGEYGSRKRRDFFVKHLLGYDPPDWNVAGK